LGDSLARPFLRAKEAGALPPPAHKGPKWKKMIQLWDQLCIWNGNTAEVSLPVTPFLPTA